MGAGRHARAHLSAPPPPSPSPFPFRSRLKVDEPHNFIAAQSNGTKISRWSVVVLWLQAEAGQVATKGGRCVCVRSRAVLVSGSLSAFGSAPPPYRALRVCTAHTRTCVPAATACRSLCGGWRACQDEGLHGALCDKESEHACLNQCTGELACRRRRRLALPQGRQGPPPHWQAEA